MSRDTTKIWNDVYDGVGTESINVDSDLANEISYYFHNLYPEDKSGIRLLEAGSGSGELSARLARDGFQVALLDQAEKPLDLSKKYFKNNKLNGKFIKGNLFDMPFKADAFDCVWNSGVIEHYLDKEQEDAVKEMKRVSNDKIIIAVPNASCFFYRVEKFYQEVNGLWKFDNEFPLKTCADIFDKCNIKLLNEDFCGWSFTLNWLNSMLGNERKVAVDKINDFIKHEENYNQFKEQLSYLLISVGTKVGGVNCEKLASKEGMKNVANIDRVLAEKITQLNICGENFQKILKENDQITEVKKQAIEEKEQTAKELQKVVNEKKQVVQDLAKKTREVSIIKASKFWKIQNGYMYCKNGVKYWIKKPKVFFLELKKKLGKVMKKYFDNNSLRISNGGKNGMVSIVMPVYNHADMLSESIDSCLNQTYNNIEIIIIDDGSTDDIESVLGQYFTNPKIRIYRTENQGLPKALSKGFNEAVGEFYTWTSADNIYEETAIEEMVKFLNSNHAVHMTYTDYRVIGPDGNYLRDSNFRTQDQDKADSSYINTFREISTLSEVQDNFIGACFLWRSYVGKIIGEWDLRMGVEDYDYWLRINASFKIEHIGKKQSFYGYRWHDNSLNARAREHKISEKAQDLMKCDKSRRIFYDKEIFYYAFSKINIKNCHIRYMNILDNDDLKQEKNAVFVKFGDNVDINSLMTADKKKVFIFLVVEKENIFASNADDLATVVDWIIVKDDISKYYYSKKYSNKTIYLDNIEKNKYIIDAILNNNLFFRKIFSKGSRVLTEAKKYFPKKINVLLEVSKLDKGGLEQVVHDIAINIDKDKFNICVVCVNDGGLMYEKVKKSNINVYDISQKNNKKEAYRDILRKEKIDIVNGHFSYFGAEVAFENNISFIDTLHNVYCWIPDSEIEVFKKRDKYITSYVAVSKNVAYYFSKRFDISMDKININPNGLNIDAYKKLDNFNEDEFREKNGFLSSDFILFMPAALSGAKGHALALAALSNVSKRMPDVKLLIMGHSWDEKYIKRIKSLIKEYKLENNVRIFDYNDEISYYYMMSDVYLQPSIFEGWSIATMEAMFYEKPMILSDVGGATDIVGDENFGIIIPNMVKNILDLNPGKLAELSKKDSEFENESELEKAIIDMYEKKKFYSDEGKLAKNRLISKFNFKKTIEALENIYQNNI